MKKIEDQIEKVLSEHIGDHIAFVRPESKEIVKAQLARVFLDNLLKQLTHKSLSDTKP
jgi:hypothetical protein